MNLKIFAVNVEEEAQKQIDLIAREENFKDCKIRIMPDVHGGMDVPIGTTIQLNEDTLIAPSLVGVDIGCGVMSMIFNTKDKLTFSNIDRHIRECIPLGFNRREEIGEYEKYRSLLEKLHCKDSEVNGYKVVDIDDALRSIGTLGGGNHYIEIGGDEEYGAYLLTVHSGSRGLGKRVAEYYMSKAVKGNGELKYLNKEDSKKYLDDMRICMKYASINRGSMIDTVEYYLFRNYHIDRCDVFDTIHNYIDRDNILRKGSISAQMHEMVAIPINMKDGVIVGIGYGDADYNYSAPHGAGRLMSRGKARKELSLEEFKEDMKDVFSTSVSDKTLDESPRAYKKLEDILPEIEKTVYVVDIYKTIYNIKG